MYFMLCIAFSVASEIKEMQKLAEEIICKTKKSPKTVLCVYWEQSAGEMKVLLLVTMGRERRLRDRNTRNVPNFKPLLFISAPIAKGLVFHLRTGWLYSSFNQ